MQDKLNINFQKGFFLALLVGLLVLVGKMFAPFLGTLMWAALFYLIISPLYRRILNRNPVIKLKIWLRFRKEFWAIIFATSSIIIVFVPLTILILELSKQMVTLLNEVTIFIEKTPQLNSFHAFEDWIHAQQVPFFDLRTLDVRATIISFINQARIFVFSFATKLAGGLSIFFISFFFMMFSLFFFLSQGEQLQKIFIHALPINAKHTTRFINRFKEAGLSIIRGFFLVAIMQGITSFIVFSIFRIPASLAFAALVSVCSFLPMFGATTIWIPLSFMVFGSYGLSATIVFMILCATFISAIDNILRPYLLGGGAKIHPLLIFFSILGGLSLFGINGLILGPLVVILFFTSMDIFLEDEEDIRRNREEELDQNREEEVDQNRAEELNQNIKEE